MSCCDWLEGERLHRANCPTGLGDKLSSLEQVTVLRSALDVMIRSMAGSYAADFKNRNKYPSHNEAMGVAYEALKLTEPDD